MTPRAPIATPLLPLLLAMALSGPARADGEQGAPGGTTAIAMQQEGSSLPQRIDPAANVPPPHLFAAAKPDDERIFMLMLLSRTTFGAFGRLGQ